MNKIKLAVINDIHFGIDDSQRIYNELHQFTDFLKSHDIDILVIDGDYFDRKLSVTDTATYLAVSYFNQLFDICKEKKIKFRMVQGTLWHELNQLQIFESRQYEDGIDFKIIKTVGKEDIDGLHVLYIPEEYPLDPEEYYGDYKKDKYNIIFGHGTWDFVAFDNQIAHGNQSNVKSVPVFMWNEWKDCIPDGFVTFGHIHGRNVYSDKIYYCGAFSRWSYGERSARGFTYIEYDLDDKKYDVKFIDNTEAPKYDEIAVEDLNINDLPVEEVQKLLDEELKKTDNLAIDLNGLSSENIEILKKVYANNPHVKIKVSESKQVLKESAEEDKKFEKYEYITKRKLPMDQTIKKFCEEDLKCEIPLDVITDILKESK